MWVMEVYIVWVEIGCIRYDKLANCDNCEN